MRSKNLFSILKLAFEALLLTSSLLTFSLFASQPADLEQQARAIAAELRCPVCQNLSVADSPSEMAQQMRSVIVEQLTEGKNPEQITAYFVSKYGDWVLLAPPRRGFSLLIWLLPFFAVTAGIVMVIFVAKRWVKRRNAREPVPVDPVLMERIRLETAAAESSEQGAVSGSPLETERAKIYGYLKDLEFDYQTGRISAEDYQDLRRRYESQAALVL
ncbi:MAG: cytochrome c-type biogenesis protein, partial [Candidatus Binatia bacterium]